MYAVACAQQSGNIRYIDIKENSLLKEENLLKEAAFI